MSAVISGALSTPVQPDAAAAPAAVTPAVPPALTSQRLQTYASRALDEVRYRTTSLGTLGLMGIGCATAAVAVIVTLVAPLQNSISQLRAAQVSPVVRDRTGAAAVSETAKVLMGLPARSQMPEVMEKILDQATAAGVELPRGQYQFVPEREGVAAHYRVSLAVKTSYPQLRSFIDRTLLALPAVGLEGLRIERKNVGEDGVEADLKLSVFVRDRQS